MSLGHSRCHQHCQQYFRADARAGAGLGPPGSHSRSPPPHGAWPAPQHCTWGQTSPPLAPQNCGRVMQTSASLIPRLFSAFPEAAWGSQLGKLRQRGRRGEGGCGAGSGGRQHPAPRWESGGRDLRWGRGMCSPGQEIVGLGERGTRLLRKQAEAERQRGRSARRGGRKRTPGAGMPAMFPLRAGVPDPLPDPLPARAKAAARPWEPVSSAQSGVEGSSSPRVAGSSSSSLGLALPQFPQPAHQPRMVVSPIPGVLGKARAVSRAESCRALLCMALDLTQSHEQGSF